MFTRAQKKTFNTIKNILFLLLCFGEFMNYYRTRASAVDLYCKATPKLELLKRTMKQLKLLRSIDVIGNETELKGSRRVAVDGLCSQEECDRLLKLAKDFAVEGDGYDGKISPHTYHEIFKGVGIGYAALLVYHELLPMDILELFLNVGIRGINTVERYFNLSTELYLEYLQIACRTEKEGPRVDRDDLSHVVHADNCHLQPNGTCPMSSFTANRHYSAVLYLNADFEGGEFFFADSKTRPQSFVKPRCGRLVGFSSGGENPHGVKGVRQGTRCAVGLWMTLDPSYEDEDMILATELLSIMKSQHAVPEQLITSFHPLTRKNALLKVMKNQEAIPEQLASGFHLHTRENLQEYMKEL